MLERKVIIDIYIIQVALMSECHNDRNYCICHFNENKETWQTVQWNGVWCQTCSPAHYAHFVFKTATRQQVCAGFGGADGVRQPRQLSVARVATLWALYWTSGWEGPSSFWSCGNLCMQQYIWNHPTSSVYMFFVLPGQKQAKKRTTLLRECAKNSSPNAAGSRSWNCCRRHLISS